MNTLYLLLFVTSVAHCFVYSNEPPPFGREMRNKMFLLDPNEIYIQHGSYGATPIPVLNSQKYYMDFMERNPLKWMSYELVPLIRKARAAVADYVGADLNNVVLVESATVATNAVLRSLVFEKGDKIMLLDIEYGMVQRTVEYLHDRYGVEIVTAKIPFPTNEEKILNAVKKTLQQHEKIKLAIFDHISSFPSLILPVEKLIKMCREKGTLVMIDGAHSLGQIPLNLTRLDPDFYFGNGHKWLQSSKGSAFLYVRPNLQSLIHPTVISHWYKEGFQQEFERTGTRDYSSYLTFIEAIQFRRWLKDERVMLHNNQLCTEVANLFTQRWGTETAAPLSMSASLITVRIPCNSNSTCYSWDMNQVWKKMMDDYRIWTYFGEHEGVRYVRLSCHIYNEKSEYEYFLRAFENIVGREKNTPQPEIGKKRVTISMGY